MVVEVALHVFARHAESPVWDAATGMLWWIDIVGERVHRFEPSSGIDTSWASDGQPGGVVLREDGTPILATPQGIAALDVPSGALTPLVEIESDKPENRTNDAKIDPSGALWVGTMAYDKRPRNAGLHRIEESEAHGVVDELTISNGPAFDARRGRMYLADTALGIVDVFDYDPPSGDLARRRRLLDFSDEGWWPDGMTLDDEGHLWLALGRSGSVRCYRPDGQLVGSVEIPTSNPTSVAFGGESGRDLYVTSSWFDLPDDERRDQPLAGAIFSCQPGVTGPSGPRWNQPPRER